MMAAETSGAGRPLAQNVQKQDAWSRSRKRILYRRDAGRIGAAGPAGSSRLNPVSASQRTYCAQGSFNPCSQAAAEQHVDKPRHLAVKARAVTVPPHLWHARQPVYVDILHLHHLVKAEFAVDAADAALLESAMRCLRDPKSRDGVVDHHSSGLNARGHGFTTFAV